MSDATDKPAKCGRPTVRTPDLEALICETLELGLSRRDAAHRAKIHPDTLIDWANKDQSFSDKLAQAECVGKTIAASTIRRVMMDPSNADGPAVSAAKFFLATRRHDAWREEQRVALSGSVSIFQAAAATVRDQDKPDEDVTGD